MGATATEPNVMDKSVALLWKVVGTILKISLLGYACTIAYRIRLYPVQEYGPLIHEFDPWLKKNFPKKIFG